MGKGGVPMMRKDKVSMDCQAQIFELEQRGYSVRKIAQALKMCRKTVRKYIKKQGVLSLKKEELQKIEMSDQDISIVSQENSSSQSIILQFPEWLQKLDWKTLLSEKKKGVSCKVLYEELNLSDVKYWAFWNNMRLLDKALFPDIPKTTMRLIHKPGEKSFVDYGDGIDIVNSCTGEVQKTWIFVGSLPFSSKIYAEFSFDQKLPSFIASHERMWKFFGGVTKYLICDNLKSAVSQARLYDPDVNKTFVAYANHAGFAVLPARPRRPKDKANVECHVGILQRSFFQEVRHKKFTSIGELNEDLRKFLDRFNAQVMKEHGVSRNDRFSEESTHLQALPREDFLIPEVREATVHPDCHIQFLKSFYSVPWQYVGKKVRVVAVANRVQIFDILSLERIALHSLSKKLGERKTEELHWPSEKQEHCNFTIERAMQDAQKIGPKTSEMVTFLFSLPYPLVYLRRVQGWLRIVSYAKCTRKAMEYASTMAMQHQKFNSSYVNDCAKYFDSNGLDRPQETGAPKRDLQHIYLQN
jgi:hypothetical protein